MSTRSPINKQSIMTRYYIVLAFVIIIMALIIARVVVINISEGNDLIRLQKTLRLEDLTIQPNRGNILSENGEVISSSIPYYNLSIDTYTSGTKEVPSLNEVDGALVQLFKNTPYHLASGSKKGTYHLPRNIDSLCVVLAKKTPFKYYHYRQYLYLLRDVDSLSVCLEKSIGDRKAQGYKNHLISMLKNRDPKKRNIPLTTKRLSHLEIKKVREMPFFRLGSSRSGLTTEQYMKRVRPYGSLASTTIGDIFGDMAKGGKNGLELSYDSLLRGEPGKATKRKIGGRWTSMPEIDPIDGCDIRTTLDVEMQDMVEQSLRTKLIEIDAQSGSVVLMETRSGKIKAMTNLGRTAPGIYTETINHAVSDELEPGSTFKVAAVMAALETGLVSPTDTVDTYNGSWKITPRYPSINDHNKDKGGYKKITVAQAIWYSSNIGVVKAVLKAFGNDQEAFADALYDMKLNEPIKFEVPRGGRPKIKHPTKNPSGWSHTTMPWMSFGYELQLPPIYTLMFYNAIANDGKMIKPYLVNEISREGETLKSMSTSTINSSICSSKTLSIIKEMLVGVVEEGTGTAVKSDIVAIAGKTGTAQISQGRAGYTSGGKSHQVSFCGYFPADDPQYSAIVVIRKPRIGYPSGGTMSGGVFKNIAEIISSKSNITAGEAAEIIPKKEYPRQPAVRGGSYARLEKVLDAFDIDYEEGDVDSKWVRASSTKESIQLSDIKMTQNLIPNVVGMGARDAVFLLEEAGLRVNISGRGRVVSQSISPGNKISRGQTIMLTLN